MKKYKQLFENYYKTITAYHGSRFDFKKFDLNQTGKTSDLGDYGKAIYFDTDENTARAYTNMNKGILYICNLKLKAYVIDFKAYSLFKRENRKLKNPELEKYIEELSNGGLRIPYNHDLNSFLSVSRKYGPEKISKAMIRNGYNSILIDYGHSKEIAVFDTNIIEIIQKVNI